MAALLLFADVAVADENMPLPAVLIIAPTPLHYSKGWVEQRAVPLQGATVVATAAQIERSHALDVTAFMNRSLGSVYVNDIQNNPLQPDLNYRGYTASPLLGTPQGLSVYLDGVRLNQGFGDIVSWDLIPRAAIASLTLVPGSNPLFGLNALGGAISIRSKDGFSDPGAAVQVTYGSWQRRSVELEVGGNTSNGWHWYATGSQLREAGWRDDSPTDAFQSFGKLGWRDEGTDVAMSGAYADSDLNGNGLQEQRLLARDAASVYTQPDNTRNRAGLVDFALLHNVNRRLSLSANAYYRHIDTDTFNGDVNDEALGENLYQPNAQERMALAAAGYSGFPLLGETQANTPFPSWRCIANILLNSEPNEKCNGLVNRTRTTQQDGGVTLQLTLDAPLGERANQLTVGAGYLASRAHFTQTSQFGFLTPSRSVATVPGIGAFADGSQDSEAAFDGRVDLSGRVATRSVYFTDTLAVAQRVHLTLSARADHVAISNRDAITPIGMTGSLSGNHDFQRINPALGVTMHSRRGTSLYMSYAHSSRAPSSIELGCADPDNPCRLPNSMAGDPPLEQVVTRTLEMGVRSRPGAALTWNAGVFRAVNDNDIMFVASGQGGFGYFKNFGQTRRQGIELGASRTLGVLSLGANYTLLDATYRSNELLNGEANSTNDGVAPGFEGNVEIQPGDRIPLTPRHILKTFAYWQVSDQWSIDVDAIALSGAFARGNENNLHQPDGMYYLGAGQTGGYSVVNLGVEFRPVQPLKLFAQIDNLFDRQYVTAAQLAATGFDGNGAFVARPFASPVIDGERPLVHSTFYAPGAPRSIQLGLRYRFY